MITRDSGASRAASVLDSLESLTSFKNVYSVTGSSRTISFSCLRCGRKSRMQYLSPFTSKDCHDLASRLGIEDHMTLISERKFKKCSKQKGCKKSGKGSLSFQHSDFNEDI